MVKHGTDFYNYIQLPMYLTSINDFIIAFFISPMPDVPLWFMRDLMVLVVISPLIYIAVRHAGLPLMIILYTGFLIGINYPESWNDTFLFSGNLNHSVTFFVTGAYLAKNQSIVIKIWNSKKLFWAIAVLWVVTLSVQVILSLKGCFGQIALSLYQLAIIFGVVYVWMAYDIYYKEEKFRFIERLLPYNFIIYVCHFYILQVASSSILSLIGRGTLQEALVFFGMPPIVISLCVLMGMVFKKVAPALYRVATGGR